MIESLGMVAIWAIVATLVIWGFHKMPGSRLGPDQVTKPALEIFNKRLARGEITREQYEEFRRISL